MEISPGSFFGRWQSRNAHATIPHCIAKIQEAGVLDNFRRVADGIGGPFEGMWFADSDLYKTLEAIGWESSRVGDPVHQAFMDEAVRLIERAQDADGYLNTAVQGDPDKERYAELEVSHELYCAGHLIQAAVAIHRGTGDDRLLRVARRFVDNILDSLSDRDDGFDGHPEIETALVELAREVDDARLVPFAAAQVDRRGHQRLRVYILDPDYFQDAVALREADEAVGHAVRQLYLLAGAADIYLESGDESLLAACVRLWENLFQKKTYLTGGHGSRHMGEAFGDAYELPSDRAYTETCAGIASFQWNWRMLLATGQARYAQAMETVLYNTIAAAMGMDGRHFFYTNPLQMRTGHRGNDDGTPAGRLSWFKCSCCPPNLARLIASLHHYLATSDDHELTIHQFVSATVQAELDGTPMTVELQTDYPWTAALTATVRAEGECGLAIRIPDGLADVTARLDGVPVPDGSFADGYVRIRRAWTGTSTLTVDGTIEPQVVHPHPALDAVRGTVALRRGPLVYCIEAVDQAERTVLEDLRVDLGAPVEENGSPLEDVEVGLTAQGYVLDEPEVLYSSVASRPASTPTTIHAIPYFAWGNRGEHAMRVWIPTT